MVLLTLVSPQNNKGEKEEVCSLSSFVASASSVDAWKALGQGQLAALNLIWEWSLAHAKLALAAPNSLFHR
jgi:hypothetical protein